MRVVRQVVLRAGGLRRLLVDRVTRRVRARVLLLLLLLLLRLLRGSLAVMLLVNDARGPRVLLQMWRNRTLLLVMRVVLLHRGNNH